MVPVSSSEFVRPAKRAAYSVMDTKKLADLLGRDPVTWQEGLEAHLAEIGYGDKLSD